MRTVLTHVKGGRGWITLDRPKALNALTLPMIQKLQSTLKEWERDDSISEVIIQSADPKAFCAGGDIKAIYQAVQSKDVSLCDSFFREEYILNAYIYTYPKPYVSLIDGIAMGGGLGISINGSHRIVTEKAFLAMPETAIGFFTDVGATEFLNNTPGSSGLFIALTGTRLDASDALWSGLATHFVPSFHFEGLKRELEEGESLMTILCKLSEMPRQKDFLIHHAQEIEQYFSKGTLLEIFEGLQRDASPFSKNIHETLQSKSPTSLAIIFNQLKIGKSLSFIDKMRMEFRISQNILHSHDFSEGVRAVLIDKDHAPRWNPSRVEDLDWKAIESYFKALGERELDL